MISREFSIQTEDDFDQFLVELIPALIKANSVGWPVLRIGFYLVQRKVLARLPYSCPRKMYIVDEPDRVRWEADDQLSRRGTISLIEVPKWRSAYIQR
ncbi:MAG: hypothetical protein WBY93_13595 [Candidatus Binatus sp.]